MAIEIKIVRKSGFQLNPKDDVVNEIFRQLERKDGHCPTIKPDRNGHDYCPCHAYLADGNCYCGLYVRKDKSDEQQ